jgi:hypothetical protein
MAPLLSVVFPAPRAQGLISSDSDIWCATLQAAQGGQVLRRHQQLPHERAQSNSTKNRVDSHQWP